MILKGAPLPSPLPVRSSRGEGGEALKSAPLCYAAGLARIKRPTRIPSISFTRSS
jgi:hypothetical protein